jgi:hypothetical protein
MVRVMAYLVKAGGVVAGDDRGHLVARAGKLYIRSVKRNARAALLAGCVLALGVVTCREATAPPLAVTLSQATRRDSLPVDSVNPRRDSVLLTLTGSGASHATWTVTHGAADWISLLTTGGTGDGVVRWIRDPSTLVGGVYVDTITITVSGVQSATRVIDSLIISGAPPAFITMRRAWLPGERDSVVARLSRDTGDALTFSPAVAEFLATSDSATVLVANTGAAAGPVGPRPAPMLGQGGQTWIMVGLQIRVVYPITPGSATMDSLKWLGVSWYASPESTWTGRVVIATSATVVRQKQSVNTADFDASYGTAGAGGGEARASTGQYWEANSGQINIRSNDCSPPSCADQTFTSGPWQGGQWHGILVGGNLISIVAPCVLGCPAPPDTFSVGFTGTPVAGLAVDCVFPSPCTGAAAIAAVRAHRAVERRARGDP